MLYEKSRKAEEVYRSLLHTSDDAIVIYDLGGKVIYVNPLFTQVFGWALEELEGKRIQFVPIVQYGKNTASLKPGNFSSLP